MEKNVYYGMGKNGKKEKSKAKNDKANNTEIQPQRLSMCVLLVEDNGPGYIFGLMLQW